MPVRKVVEIDRDKCDGCGLCVDACHEGAIEIVDGKATLVSESYCDGLGACLPECPQDAIRVVEREAAPFDAEAVAERQARERAHQGPRDGGRHDAPVARPVMDARPTLGGPAVPLAVRAPSHGGCPGAMSRMLAPKPRSVDGRSASTPGASALANWPVQLHLAPIQAPYFRDARLLVAADCVPFAYPDFHEKMLSGRTLLIGCPKLDDTSAYLEKLAAIIRFNDIAAVEVVYMQVPCCHGLVRLVERALANSGKGLSLELTKVGITGEILERQARPAQEPIANGEELAARDAL